MAPLWIQLASDSHLCARLRFTQAVLDFTSAPSLEACHLKGSWAQLATTLCNLIPFAGSGDSNSSQMLRLCVQRRVQQSSQTFRSKGFRTAVISYRGLQNTACHWCCFPSGKPLKHVVIWWGSRCRSFWNIWDHTHIHQMRIYDGVVR